MKLIVITPEIFFEEEASAIRSFFENGLKLLHLRKPNATREEIEGLLNQIDSRYHKYIMLHDHFSLLDKFDVRSVHLNRRNPHPPKKENIKLSKSCHSFQELEDISGYDYVFLSPIFDSISKTGYNRAFSETELIQAHKQGLINERVIALGGIAPKHVSVLTKYGFGGIAVLGGLWGNFPETKNVNALSERFSEYQQIANRQVRR